MNLSSGYESESAERCDTDFYQRCFKRVYIIVTIVTKFNRNGKKFANSPIRFDIVNNSPFKFGTVSTDKLGLFVHFLAARCTFHSVHILYKIYLSI